MNIDCRFRCLVPVAFALGSVYFFSQAKGKNVNTYFNSATSTNINSLTSKLLLYFRSEI